MIHAAFFTVLAISASAPAKNQPTRPAFIRLVSDTTAGAAADSNVLTPAVLDRLERLTKMSSEQRSQALADLPPAQRQKIEKGLESLDALTPEQRANWFKRLRVFNILTDPQKEAVRIVMKEFLALPLPRRKAVREELETYKHMPLAARESRMKSADFRQKFSAEERGIVERSAALMPVPGSQ